MNTSTLLDLLSHTALKGAAVLLLALLLGLGLRRMAAARRYALWITAIATLAVLPLAMWALPAWHVLPPTDSALEWPVMEPPLVIDPAAPSLAPEAQRPALPVSKSALPMPVQVAAPAAISWYPTWQDAVAALPVVWISIAALLLLRLVWSAWCLRRLEGLLKSGRCDALAEIAQEIGLSRVPRLFVGDASTVPMVWGVWKPRLLLPAGFEEWSAAKLRGVLLHELAHLKRRDPLALWTAQWVKALHWFNPLMWLTLRQLRADQERACDDAVLRHGVRASVYAQTLLDLSRHNRLAPGLSLCALTITRSVPVETRVKAILDPTRRREGLTLRWLAGLAGGALLITLPVAMLHAIEGPTLRGHILDRNGVVLAESTKEKVRNYPLKTLAAHTLGYVRRSDMDGAVQEGRAAIEKQQNDTLKAGKDVTLTLDARIQALTMRAMKDGGVTRGAAVVLDPRTGEILASVSLPSFDPNAFIPSVSFGEWARYLHDKNVPLMDRSQSGFFQPDAALTPLTGLAAISAGVGQQSFTCQSPVKTAQAVYSCWRLREGKAGHGSLSLDTAMEQGCWYYWFQLGMAAGFPKMAETGSQLGFGSTYGLVEEAQEGVWPTQEWWENHRSGKRAWPESNTAELAMGQGYVKATPMQMAVLAATMANSGMAPQPHFIRGAGVSKLADFHFEGTQAAQMQKLREGMRLVVNGTAGTGQSARSDKVMIAGKNAMFQRWHRINQKPELTYSWFIGFAPFDRPTLAFAILKQGSKSEDDDATPIAKRIVEETLALPADGSGDVLSVEEDLSGLQLAQAQFDAKADVLRAVLESIKAEGTTGFPLDEIRVRNGQILIRGAALGMIQALQFRDKVLAIKWEDPLEWNFPVPQILADRKRVGFMMLGTLLWEGKTTTPLEDVQASLVSLNDPRAYGWEELRKTAGLAELPGGTEARRGEAGDPCVNFYLLRKNVAGWLRASLGTEVDVGWLEKETAKIQNYPAKNGYKVEVLPMTSPNLFKVTVKPPGKTTAAAPAAKIDFYAGETSQQIKALSEEVGIVVKEFKMGKGMVSILGEASGMLPARKYLFKLLELGKERNVRWTLPAPKVLKNQSVQFEASGTYGTEVLHDAPPEQKASASSKPASKDQFPISDDVIRLQLELAKQWSHLKAAGLLADLPAEAVVSSTDTARLEQYTRSKHVVFQFSVPREAARRWLLDSVFVEEQREKLLHWSNSSASFHDTFTAANNCGIIVSYQKGETVHVMIFQPQTTPDESQKKRPLQKLRPFRPILIAPDESQEPRPAGRLAPEYHGKGLSESERTTPTLDVSSQTLRPTVSPQGVQLPTFRPQQGQLRLRVAEPPSAPTLGIPSPLNRLHGELSEESEKALRRSMGSGTRM